ncbi:MAG TPA: hypothetical protein VFZ72_05335 [Jiangellaceae bacterium]
MSKARVMAVAAIGLLAAACGGDNDAATATGDDGTTLSITAPSDGAEVSVPFTVEIDSSEEIGTTDTGLHHVHVYWDGDESAFTLVETDSVEITDAPEGQHTLSASLHNADHTPAGVEVDITLTVGEGSESDDGDGYSY